LTPGARVPADLRLVAAKKMRIDQAALTGESELISATTKCTDKNYLQSRNMVFMGTSVVDGTATGIVVSVGNNTVMGLITSRSSHDSRLTYLQREIRRLVIII